MHNDNVPLLTAEEMRSKENWAIDRWGMPSLVLQEHAAIGALALIPEGEPIRVLAGPGNNGGDALALARLAFLQGRGVEVWVPGVERPQWKGDAATQAKLWEGLGGKYKTSDDPSEEISNWRGWVVDGLFGLGTKLPIGGDIQAWVVAFVTSGLGFRRFKVLALDLPTGLDPSSGDTIGLVIRADRTACFGHLKRCHGLMPARDFCGDISLIPIPLTELSRYAYRLGMLHKPTMNWPRWDTHKYELGHVAIRAGTKGMAGAAVLAAIGALRGGAGLVTIMPDAAVAGTVAAQVPEAIVKEWEGCGGKPPGNADVLLVGPGGVSDVPDWDGPLVLDASALGPGEGQKWMSRPNTILTPHAGEFSRLFGMEIGRIDMMIGGRSTQERLDAVEMILAESSHSVGGRSAVLMLKGAQTIVAGGGSMQMYVNPTGHPGLSTGGTGDFLAGLVAARYAQGTARYAHDPFTPLKAACEAVWLHGAAADRLGAGPLMVRDLGPSLAELLREMRGA